MEEMKYGGFDKCQITLLFVLLYTKKAQRSTTFSTFYKTPHNLPPITNSE